ncbi:hypothetical protein [Amycolatopsis lexingtonensis]|uniref:hypothetical protein n=1 Tax=Amycolatopsis lexingtonensis TaxID=218822 RepID=UPI003F6ED8EF
MSTPTSQDWAAAIGFQTTPPETWRWDSDRPGPPTIPDGATTCTVRYDAEHDFFLSAAKS